ncbi:MAG: hypothetical protein WC607_01310 [Candidatus Micrarchaeia archaeon]
MHSIVKRLKSKVLQAKVTPEGVGIIQLHRKVTEAEFAKAAKAAGLSTGFQKSKKYLEARSGEKLVVVLVDHNHLVIPKDAPKQTALEFAETLLGR